jgi:hypothetical protein
MFVTWAGMEFPVEDFRHDTVWKPNEVVVRGGPIERRNAGHDGHCTSPIHIARADESAGKAARGDRFVAA